MRRGHCNLFLNMRRCAFFGAIYAATVWCVVVGRLCIYYAAVCGKLNAFDLAFAGLVKRMFRANIIHNVRVGLLCRQLPESWAG